MIVGGDTKCMVMFASRTGEVLVTCDGERRWLPLAEFLLAIGCRPADLAGIRDKMYDAATAEEAVS